MGYTTEFEGILKFTQPLTAEQELFLREILPASYEHTDDHPEWIKPEGYRGYIQLEIAPDKSGIQWDGNEKFYDAVEAVQTVILTMRNKFPEFGLTGDLLAQGEELKDRWYLRVINNVAEHVGTDQKIHKCPECRHEWADEAA